MEKNIAVLLTCFNRKSKTLNCLDNLFTQGIDCDVFLVDDGSTDGTGEAVKQKYPAVTVIRSNGDLFWNGGMRLAWQEALKAKKYNFFMWLNDDTLILPNGLKQLFADYDTLHSAKNNNDFVITAACKKPGADTFTYGGRNGKAAVKPNGQPQKCSFINGNMVLIPYEVYNKIGILSDKYTHAMGDFDYGLRAKENNVQPYTTSYYIAECDTNPVAGWMDSAVPFKKRWNLMHSPKGLNAKEFLYFTRRHRGFLASAVVFAKIYFHVLFPGFYKSLKTEKR